MKIALYSPYIPTTFGGGEKHILDIATILAEKQCVTIAVSKKYAQSYSLVAVQKAYEAFYGASLDSINFSWTPLGSGSTLTALLWTRQFDYLFAVSDGSLFFSLAKHNILHIQIPFTHTLSFLDSLKLTQWQINTNSHFTKRVIQKHWNTQVTSVLYPAVDSSEFDAAQKSKKIRGKILSVGRFFTKLHAKRQDVLISAFKELYKQLPKNQQEVLELVLIGAVEDASYVAQLKEQAKGYPIRFLHSVSRADLIDQYKDTYLYWHAAGYGVDEEQHPEATEHFGIVILEAIAAGCIPCVYKAGGVVEILSEKEVSHLLWSTKTELLSLTKDLLTKKSSKNVTDVLVTSLDSFSKKQFIKEVYDLFK